MKGTLKLVAHAAVALGTLALAAPALAAYTSPRLTITNPDEKTSGGGRLSIQFAQVREDDATAKVTIYVPQGYTSSLVPQAGQTLGTATALVNATAISPDAIVPVDGGIVGDVYDPARYPTGAQCAGAAPIDGVWRLELTAAGQNLTVPAYVQTVTAGPEAAFASGKITFCLASPYAEAGTARAQLGAKLLSATLNIRGVFTNPTTRGAYRWRALATPWTANSGAVNPLGTVEVQALDTIPVNLTMAARVNNRLNRVTLTGRLAENAVGLSGRVVQIRRGGRVLRSVRTNARGTFTATLRLRPGRYTLQARTTRASADIGAAACTPTFTPVPCIAMTSSSYAVSVFVNRRVIVRVR